MVVKKALMTLLKALMMAGLLVLLVWAVIQRNERIKCVLKHSIEECS